MKPNLDIEPAPLIAALLCIAAGVAVAAAWLIEPAALAASFPIVFGMQFNAALAFVLLGVALLAVESGRRSAGLALIAPAAILTGLTLYEHVSGTDLGLGTLFIEPFIRPGSGVPGRMAPNSALAFVLICAALLVRELRGRESRAAAMLAFLVVLIAAISLIGYTIGLDRARDWTRVARMSPANAVCFAALGAALLLTGEPTGRRRLPFIAASLAVATYMALLVIAYAQLRYKESLLDFGFFASMDRAGRTLSSLILISGVVYIGLIAYTGWSWSRYRRSSASLFDSQNRLSAVLDNAVDGIISIDARGKILSTNPVCEKIFGYARADMIGNNVQMLMPEPYRGEHDSYLENYARTGEAKVIGIGREVEGRRKDGSVFPLDLAVAKVELSDGVIYTGVVRDISERRKLIRQLAESRERLAAVIDNAVDGIITIDGVGTIASVNKACEKIFGYRPDEMIGRNVKMLMPEPYHGEHDGYLANYARTGKAKIIGIGREVEGRRKDGSTFPLDLAVAKVDVPDGMLYCGIIRDISLRKRHEAALLDANAELEEFAYRTSHDLRSPIASSLGLLGIAGSMLEEGDHEGLRGALGRLDRNFVRLDKMIQNIIVLTRNKLVPEEDGDVNVRDCVTEALDSIAQLETSPQLRVDLDIDPQLTFRTKPTKFQVIVGNLVSNAIKYQDPGEENPRIDIRAESRDGVSYLHVDDNGIGVPPDSRPMLFKMFKRLHPDRSFGSGLGLYILKKNAEALGGTARYEPLDKGSRFIVELPERRMHADEVDPGG